MRQTLDAGRLPAIRFKPDLQTRPGCQDWLRYGQVSKSRKSSEKRCSDRPIGNGLFSSDAAVWARQYAPGGEPGRAGGQAGVNLRRTSRKPGILYLLVGTPKVRATAAANISPATNPNSEIQSDLFMIAKTPLLLDPHLFTANKIDMRTHRC